MYEDSSREKEDYKRKVAKENYQEKKACSRNVIHSRIYHLPFTNYHLPIASNDAPAACCF